MKRIGHPHLWLIKTYDLKSWVLIIALLLLWIITVYERISYIGTLSEGNHQWLTASTLKFVENWLSDGLFFDRGLMLEMPHSIEFKDFHARDPYVSYLPGAVFQIYLLKGIFTKISTLLIIQVYGLANQLLISILIFKIVLNIQEEKSGLLYLTSFAAGVSYLTFSDLMYWHSMVYFADQSVLLPFALVLYLESRIRSSRANLKTNFIFQGIIITYSFFLDYLALPLAAVLFIFRFLSPLKTSPYSNKFNFIQLGLGIAILFICYTLFLYWNDLLENLIRVFFYRIGATDKTRFTENFFYIFFIENLGIYPTFFLAVTTIFFIKIFLKGKSESQKSVVSLVAIFCVLLQVLLLRNHSAVHNFSAMKFYIPLCIASIGIMPFIFMTRIIDFFVKFKSRGLKAPPPIAHKNKIQRIVSATYIFFLAVILIPEHLKWEDSFPHPGFSNEKLAIFLKENSNFEDIYIAKKELLPPHALGISGKRVYPIKNKEELIFFMSNIPINSKINIVLEAPESCKTLFNRQYVIGTKFAIFNTTLQDVNNLTECLFNE